MPGLMKPPTVPVGRRNEHNGAAQSHGGHRFRVFLRVGGSVAAALAMNQFLASWNFC
jgi:hypothetical protein